MSYDREHDAQSYTTRSGTPHAGLGAISLEDVEKAFTQALREFFPVRSKNPDARAEFFALYQREAEEYDKEFIKKYDEDLNTTLIFAGLFSGVTSGFIIDAQANLQEDHVETTATLLRMLLQKTDNPAFVPDFDSVAWNGPPAVIVHVLSVLYCSIAASLLAAFIAMLGKQWLNGYERVGNRGSLIERSRDRQKKTDGMAKWQFHFVMECLSLILQAAVLLLGYALSQYMWTINHTVSSVIIGFTIAGLIFYSFIVIASIISYNCPFQTPVSTVLRHAIYYKHKRALLRSMFSRVSAGLLGTWKKSHVPLPKRKEASIHRDLESNPGPRETPMESEKRVETMFDTPPLSLDKISDIGCASWLMKTSTDADVTLAVVRFVPDIERHSTKATPSLSRLYEALSACFDSPDDFHTPEMRTKAYEAAKMFIQVYWQRRCVTTQYDVLEKPSLPTGNIPECSPDDSDLYSMLGMVQEILNDARSEVGLTSTLPSGISFQHLSWILHILLYRIWEFQRDGVAFPEFIHEFLRNSFSVTEISSEDLEPFLSDYFLAVGLTVGLQIDPHDLLIREKSEKIGVIISCLYNQLTYMFNNLGPGQDVQNLLAALAKLNVGIPAHRLAMWSSQVTPHEEDAMTVFISVEETLFKAIMTSRIPEDDRRQAARRLLEIVFRNRPFHPHFKDSSCLMAVLKGHFPRGYHRDPQGIADTFEALSSPYLHPPPDFNITQHLQYILESLSPEMPGRLRRNALLFIDWFGDSGSEAIGSSVADEGRAEFCRNLAFLQPDDSWSTAHKMSYSRVLLRMVNSQTWLPHMLLNQWVALESLSSFCERVGLLNQCMHNERLLPSLWDLPEGNTVMKLWLKIVWRQSFEGLSPSLVAQIEEATYTLFCREGELTMQELKTVINPHHALGADAEKRMSTRRRESMLEELCTEANRFLHPHDERHSSPVFVSSPTRGDTFMSDQTFESSGP